MALTVTTHWDTSAAQAALKRWTLVARNNVRQAVHDTATDMATAIAANAPVATGALADSIQVDHEVDSFDSWGAATVYTDSLYARRIELGFHGVDSLGRSYSQSGTPYWGPGFNAAAATFEARIRAALLA